MRREPLLPHFTFKIRCGDSLVQEVGGINFGHIRAARDIPKEIQSRVVKLKTEKLKFYDNDPDCHFKSPDQVKREELRLFQDILDARHHKVQEEIKSLRRKIEGPIGRQLRLDGKVEEKPHQIALDSVLWQKQIESLTENLEQIDRARSALRTTREIPFVWDIAFVEIFESEKEGFDIAIGNPPYVRQENIADPHLFREGVTTENKKEYKTKLARSVYQAFPNFFSYRTETDTAAHKLDAKSDLYIYFYFRGLSLLNPKGSFCFITSNSWLDVGYGKDLQEFLLKHSHIKMILDNQAKRSFAQADVNTVIVLLSTPDDSRDWASGKTARFVMFKVPFEHILSPIIFDEIEAANDRKSTPEYHISPVGQNVLLEGGWEWPDDVSEETKKRFGQTLKGSKYGGNKWGGKYLRAPDIYWTILEKGKGKLVAIEPDIGRVLTVAWSRQGHNKEIMVSNTDAGRGERIPVLKSPREFDGIIIRSNNAKTFLRIGLVEKNQIVRTPLVWDDIRGEKHICRLNQDMLAFTHNFHGIQPHNASLAWLICACLNSTLAWLFVETLGRRGLGGGGIRILVQDMKRTPLLIHPDRFSSRQIKTIRSAFDELSSRPIHNVSIELMNDKGDLSPKPDRYSLDSIIFDVLGLVQDERNAVYQTVVSLVADRLRKASSLDPKDRQKRSMMGNEAAD